MKTIFGRTFAATAALLIASFVLLGSSVAMLSFRYNREEREQSLTTSAEYLVDAAGEYTWNGDVVRNPYLSLAVSLSAKMSGSQIAITNSTGLLVASPEGVESSVRLYVSENVMERVKRGEYVGSGNLGIYAGDFFTVGLPVRSNGEFCGAVFVSVTSTAFQKMIGQFIKLFVIMAVLVLAVSSLWAYFYTRRLTEPLKQMADASRAFGRGDFGERVATDEDTALEIRDLAASLNRMAESLDKSETRRREFIANVSHELKTPMTSISGYVDGILDGVIPPEKEKKYLETVSAETKRLSRLVAQMLELSRMEAEEDEPIKKTAFDLCETARQVLIAQERKITDKNLEVSVELDEPAEVLGDADSIYRVVFNLVENAVKYSDEGTPLEIRITKQGGRALFEVSDIGRPIPPEEKELIFERFHKTDRSRASEGLGLGLYLVKRILARHGEDVVCMPDGKRTTMRFGLALVPKR